MPDVQQKARAEVRQAQAEFERANAEREKASTPRRESFERAREAGLTLRDIGEPMSATALAAQPIRVTCHESVSVDEGEAPVGDLGTGAAELQGQATVWFASSDGVEGLPSVYVRLP